MRPIIKGKYFEPLSKHELFPLTDGARYKIQEQTAHIPASAQGGQSHFSLRTAQWRPSNAYTGDFRPALPPLQSVHDLKIEPHQARRPLATPRERQYSGGMIIPRLFPKDISLIMG